VLEIFLFCPFGRHQFPSDPSIWPPCLSFCLDAIPFTQGSDKQVHLPFYSFSILQPDLFDFRRIWSWNGFFSRFWLRLFPFLYRRRGRFCSYARFCEAPFFSEVVNPRPHFTFLSWPSPQYYAPCLQMSFPTPPPLRCSAFAFSFKLGGLTPLFPSGTFYLLDNQALQSGMPMAPDI